MGRKLAGSLAVNSGQPPTREVTATELFTIYTRLAFGVTTIIAAACVLFELIGEAL